MEGVNRRLPGITPTDSLRKRFWEKVAVSGPDDCWPWRAGLRNGYGAIKVDGRVYSGHRVAYSLTFGEPGDSLVVAHKCDNRYCCNPNHLEAISQQQNNKDARERVQFYRPRGEQVANAVLTADLVRKAHELRTERKWGATRIAAHLGLSYTAISKALYGETWKHVSPQ